MARIMEHKAKAVLQNCCKTIWDCVLKTKAKNGFTHLKIGGYRASTPWDTFLLAHVGEV